MSNKPNTHHRPTRRTPKRHSPKAAVAIGAALAAVVALAALLAASLSIEPDPASNGEQRAAAPARTGQTNAMGMPVVATPGSASGTARAGGVEVVGANWDMGRVPLDVAVRPSWTLRDTSNATVTLGEPKSEVRAGCCPGPFTVGARTLAPGESTEVTFELSMHKGMDGPHDLGVHVPVVGPAGADHLTLSVAGDFR
jgi:hypothetical protein